MTADLLQELEERFNDFKKMEDPEMFSKGFVEYLFFIDEMPSLNIIKRKISFCSLRKYNRSFNTVADFSKELTPEAIFQIETDSFVKRTSGIRLDLSLPFDLISIPYNASFFSSIFFNNNPSADVSRVLSRVLSFSTSGNIKASLRIASGFKKKSL